ncbi:Digeranylgeranylglyceryl phosphate synthase [Cytospora mali]|uniref:Digeranylgeranylglyceryl phosphate synthase n=1 Tax=Cytospora mali TaxID=578113 RepID=A0A194WBF5_CYTMA|nr:Digeranylgeranylglyceryl phosphate synthase [Valsa mali]
MSTYDESQTAFAYGLRKKIASTISQCSFDLLSIWLFTFSDLKTIVGPKAVFGLVHALSAEVFDFDRLTTPSDLRILLRTPFVIWWIWINLLPFSIDNQRQPSAVLEDAANKPWRPLPSQRIESEQAKKWMLALYPVAVLTSIYAGGLRQCLALVLLGIWYNDLGGSDTHFLTRNFINACGFVCYASGAMEVALGRALPVSLTAISWFSMIAAVVLTSVHSQDMADQEGDRLRGRKSVPLAIGDTNSRWTIAIFVSAFSIFGPFFWNLDWLGYAGPVILGSTVAVRTLSCRSVRADKMTFRIWNLWLVGIYFLPLVARRSLHYL